MTETETINRIMQRVARLVDSGTACVSTAARRGMLLLDAGDKGTISVPGHVVDLMRTGNLVAMEGCRLRLTPAGRAIVQPRRKADVLPEGVGNLELIVVEDGSADGQKTMADLSESPLAQIARHRGRDGKRFLDAVEVNAGERLRRDYTRGQIMPRLGANWVAAVASGRRGDAGAGIELTDAALAARLRVEKAIAAVGPELSGVLIDVCCYLKGMERVEAERGWPARSAKIVLKSALGVLSRHYDPPVERPMRARMLHWGSTDYRPAING